jgi:hypothetical protein
MVNGKIRVKPTPSEAIMIPEPEQAVVLHALAEPFPAEVLKWKPQVVNGNRALAIPYIDARCVMDRLDEFVGPDGWQNELEFLENGTVLCRLKILVNGQWLEKADVGAPSEQPDEGDRCKAAASDALKRSAVLWGIGRYLYSLGGQWLDYDAKKKMLIGKPTLPDWALPKKARDSASPTTNSTPAKPHALPASGEELETRLAAFDSKLASEGLFAPGDLLRFVGQVVSKAGPGDGRTYGGDVRTWPEAAIRLACEEAKDFEKECRTKQARKEATRKRIAEKAV